MRTLRTVAVLSLGAVLMLGCGKSSSNKEPLNVKTLAATLASTVCSEFAKCSCTDPSAVKDCTAAYTEMLTIQFSSQVAGSQAVKVDSAKAQTCIADIKATLSTCSAPPPYVDGFPASCDEFFVGTQTADELCDGDQDCAPGLACDRRTWTCATPVAVDGDCTGYYLSCAEGLFCNGSVCKAIPAAGQECPDEVCQDGLSCVYVTADTKWECVAPHAATESCADGAGCVDTARCVSGTCVALTADGGACKNWYECLHGWCNTYDWKCADPGICWMMSDK